MSIYVRKHSYDTYKFMYNRCLCNIYKHMYSNVQIRILRYHKYMVQRLYPNVF